MICGPRGFFAAGIHCGLKKAKKDLALIYSEVPATAAGMFTANRLAAHPVKLSKSHLKAGKAQAIVVNSGVANAGTGEAGKNDALAIVKETARLLKITPARVLVASTGKIGERLPVKIIAKALPHLVKGLKPNGSSAAAQAIMTTDTYPKEAAVAVKIGKCKIRIAGIAKGAGMISPDLATMLCFLTTDARISSAALKRSLRDAVEASFNRITIDGDMSTNDSVMIMANGLAGNKCIETGSADYRIFSRALGELTRKLAKMIVGDGEGVSRVAEIEVGGARSEEEALAVGRRVANSPLVKTALYGADPNWGRIVAAVGASGAKVVEKKLQVSLEGMSVFQKGEPVNFNYQALRRKLKKKEIKIKINLGIGKKSATIWTGDLTEEYIKINTEY